MKLEITQPGARDAEGKEMPIGTEVNIEGDAIPGWLINKARPVGKVAITNPAKGAVPIAPDQGRMVLLGEASKLIDEDAFMADGRPDVRAVNAVIGGGDAPFTAAERDALWPDVAEAVMAARG